VPGLKVDLKLSQVEAASRLHGNSRLGGWRQIDAALDRLKSLFPDFDNVVEVLLQVVAVNQLYGANVFSVVPMARHIVTNVMSRKPRLSDPDLVEAISSVGGRNHRSFASKFCHFFVDSEVYPIFDKYVGMTLNHHLGAEFPFHDGSNPPPYKSVLAGLDALRMRVNLDELAPRALDRYLWLSGLYRSWTLAQKKGKKPKINSEVAAMFDAAKEDPQLRVDICAMCP
jgi:hypothetical protein